MPITQIPFQDQDPAAPPEKPQPEQLALYDLHFWGTEDHDAGTHEPHLLIQLQDDLERSRKREAAWISIIVHLVLAIVLWNFNFIEKYMPWHRVTVVAVDPNKDKNVTFLALPPDLQKVPRKPNTNIPSDKDRVASTRHPELDPKELRKVLASPPPGLPGMTGRRFAAPPAPPQPMAQNQPPVQQPQQAQPSPRPQFDSNQITQLQTPPRPDNSFAKYAAGMTPGHAIQQAAQGAAANRAGGGGQAGDFGLNTGARGRAQGNFEVLSDTLGVDFGPYLARIRTIIEMHWYDSLPPSFFPPISKKGKLLIQFSILPDGRVAAMQLVASSDDTSLDRAAWGAITGSNPFPPLPEPYVKIGGRDLTLRCLFAYNLEEKDLQ